MYLKARASVSRVFIQVNIAAAGKCAGASKNEATIVGRLRFCLGIKSSWKFVKMLWLIEWYCRIL